MSASDESSLSSAESIETDEELLSGPIKSGGLKQYFKKASSSPPPRRKRPASPPHEYVLADNPDIAFLVMFRARFSAAFPRSLTNFGPQDIERGVVDALPDEGVEKFLCCLIGLVLNRKKDVERGHHTRALEEAVQTHAHQWPQVWEGENPLHKGGSFNNMTPQQRLAFLKALVLWSLSSSDAIQAIIKENHKQQRHEDDLNQPLSVQPWGRDGDKRRYWLIEGQDDTHFRLYRESNPALKTNTWFSVADSIDSIKDVARKLEEDGTQAARKMKDRITAAIPRFEAGEEKRKRRDYRLQRKAQFRRPDPGFSMYEGRTRGKRIRYTFSDEEGDEGSDEPSNRRSTRNSGISTPAEPAGPTFTASGRQVKSRVGGEYGEKLHSGQQDLVNADMDGSDEAAVNDAAKGEPGTRSRRSEKPANGAGRANIAGYNALDDMGDESDASSSGNEWNGGDDDDDDVDDNENEDVDMSDDSDGDEEDDTGNKSLVVSLRYPQSKKPTPEIAFVPRDIAMTNGDSPADSIALINGAATPAVEMKLENGMMPALVALNTTDALEAGVKTCGGASVPPQ